LSATNLIARLRELGVRLSADNGELLVDAPEGVLTEALREEIRRHKKDILVLFKWSRRSNRAVTAPLQRVSREQSLPLSFAQQRLWFLDQLEPGSSAYNISWTVRLRGELKPEELQKAVDSLVVRHESLRTVFPTSDGQPEQKILADVAVPIDAQIIDVASEERIRARLSVLAAAPFDLATGPLLRVHLLRIAEREHVMLVLIHHIVADGASMRVLFRELANLYDGYASGHDIALAPLPVQYADYSVWQREWLSGEELQQQLDYWVKRMAGAPPVLELPADRPRAAAQTFRGASVLRVLPEDLAEDLRSLARDNGCTLFGDAGGI